MSKRNRLALLGLVIIGFLALAGWYLSRTNIPVLEPRGYVGQQEKHLIVIALLLSLTVVIPVFMMLFGFAWKYRETNHRANYRPDWDHNPIIETVWWLIPTVLIVILSVITWNSSHQLDPYRPLAAKAKPLTIQVVALDWKWLFIYPEQNVASVNLVDMPVGTPVNFEITADAPMNSFWIPQLGGQIYAMPGMSTELHLVASRPGSYYGSSANISGVGFAGMNFVARASSPDSFNNWVQAASHSSNHLSLSAYKRLSAPSQNNRAAYYSAPQAGLYYDIVAKFMTPTLGSYASSPAANRNGAAL